MTVPAPDQLEYISDADGVTKDFAYPKRFLQKSEIVVAFRSNNSDTIKSLGIDYTIAGTSWPSGADVSFAVAPPAGVQVVRYRRTAITQTVDLENNQRNDAPSVELQLDRLTMALQDSDKLARGALRTDAAEGYRLAPPVAEKLLAWDADGKAVVSSSKTLAELDAGIAGAQAAQAAAEAARDRAVTAESNAEVSKDAAASSATSANASKNSAANSATGAASSADLAGTRAAQASSSATAASGSASAAATQATNASNSATAAAGSAATASTKANEAGQAAAASASSASAAQAARTASESARDSATTSAANANTSATASEASAADALAAKNIAQGSAIDAANSATVAQSAKAGAETAEGAAASSATAAGNSAASAASSATDAGESKNAAAASATSALSSATSAGSSASAASASATNAQSSANLAQSVTASMSGGTSGQFLVKKSNTDYDYEWANIPGGGDMLASVYDPSGKAVDAFSMSNMDEGADAKILTAAERTAIAANTSARHTHSNKGVLDTTTASFTTTLKTKLDGIPSDADKTPGVATTTANGLMSAEDKAAVDGLPAAFAATEKTANKGQNNGYASLGPDGKIPSSQLPPVAITDTFVVNSQAAMLALTVQVGDIAVRTDLTKSFILRAEPGTVLANWQELLTPPNAVISVNGETGAVVITAGGIGAATETALSNLAQATTNELAGKLNNTGNQVIDGGLTLPWVTITDVDQPLYDNNLAPKKYVDEAVASAGGLGVNQTWQNVTSSRSFGTTYQNTSGKPIEVSIVHGQSVSSIQGVTLRASPDNTTFQNVAEVKQGVSGATFTTGAVIPDGYFYRAENTVAQVTLTRWLELR